MLFHSQKRSWNNWKLHPKLFLNNCSIKTTDSTSNETVSITTKLFWNKMTSAVVWNAVVFLTSSVCSCCAHHYCSNCFVSCTDKGQLFNKDKRLRQCKCKQDSWPAQDPTLQNFHLGTTLHFCWGFRLKPEHQKKDRCLIFFVFFCVLSLLLFFFEIGSVALAFSLANNWLIILIYSFFSCCAFCRSALSMATMFSAAAYRCTRLIPVFTTATGAHNTHRIYNRNKMDFVDQKTKANVVQNVI